LIVYGRKLRDDVEVRVEVVELLAHGEEDDAPDERAGDRRIECVGLFGEPDRERAAAADVGGRPGGAGGRDRGRERGNARRHERERCKPPE